MEPNDLARELGVTGRTLRGWLRTTYPRGAVDHGARWLLTAEQVEAARRRFRSQPKPTVFRVPGSVPAATAPRATSDEAYVIDLCDEILEEEALRQHRFDWLLGDPGRNGSRVALPVDAYYPGRRLVVEYRERQHDEPIAHFDKPDRMTVSGVHRGEQRRLYDRRREEEIPAHGLRLMIIRPGDLGADRLGRLRRYRQGDLAVLRAMLSAL